jgi:hypothetical protein
MADQNEEIEMNKHIFTGIALALSLGSTAVSAQVVSNSGLVLNTSQSLVGANIGNGITAGQSIVTIQAKGTPAIGVGALSGNPDHYGSAASVSLLNSVRLLGVDSATGPNGANSISLKNPNPGPILSTLVHP